MADRKEFQYTVHGQTWTLDYHALTLDDWAAAERATGMHWAQVAAAMDARSALGLKVGLWLARRREKPSLGYNAPEMKIRPDELTFDVIGDDGEEGEQRSDPPDPRSDGSPSTG